MEAAQLAGGKGRQRQGGGDEGFEHSGDLGLCGEDPAAAGRRGVGSRVTCDTWYSHEGAAAGQVGGLFQQRHLQVVVGCRGRNSGCDIVLLAVTLLVEAEAGGGGCWPWRGVPPSPAGPARRRGAGGRAVGGEGARGAEAAAGGRGVAWQVPAKQARWRQWKRASELLWQPWRRRRRQPWACRGPGVAPPVPAPPLELAVRSTRKAVGEGRMASLRGCGNSALWWPVVLQALKSAITHAQPPGPAGPAGGRASGPRAVRQQLNALQCTCGPPAG